MFLKQRPLQSLCFYCRYGNKEDRSGLWLAVTFFKISLVQPLNGVRRNFTSNKFPGPIVQQRLPPWLLMVKTFLFWSPWKDLFNWTVLNVIYMYHVNVFRANQSTKTIWLAEILLTSSLQPLSRTWHKESTWQCLLGWSVRKLKMAKRYWVPFGVLPWSQLPIKWL